MSKDFSNKYTEVSFTQAISAWVEGTEVRCTVPDGQVYTYSNFESFEDSKEYAVSNTEITKGNWEIKALPTAQEIFAEKLEVLAREFRAESCSSLDCSDCPFNAKPTGSGDNLCEMLGDVNSYFKRNTDGEW